MKILTNGQSVDGTMWLSVWSFRCSVIIFVHPSNTPSYSCPNGASSNSWLAFARPLFSRTCVPSTSRRCIADRRGISQVRRVDKGFGVIKVVWALAFWSHRSGRLSDVSRRVDVSVCIYVGGYNLFTLILQNWLLPATRRPNGPGIYGESVVTLVVLSPFPYGTKISPHKANKPICRV